MKRVLILFSTVLLISFFAGCGDKEDVEKEKKDESQTEDVEEETSEEDDKEDPIEVEIEANPVIEKGKVYIEGETNIPDHAELMFTISNDEYKGQSTEVVKGGKFKTETFTDDGDSLPVGEYELSISLSVPNTQDDKFVKVAGEEYENLTGDLMEESELGKSMNYTTTFDITGEDVEGDSEEDEGIAEDKVKELFESSVLGENDELTALDIDGSEIKAVVELGGNEFLGDKELAETVYGNAGDALLEHDGWEVLTIEFVDVGEVSMNRDQAEINELGMEYFPIDNIIEQLN